MRACVHVVCRYEFRTCSCAWARFAKRACGRAYRICGMLQTSKRHEQCYPYTSLQVCTCVLYTCSAWFLRVLSCFAFSFSPLGSGFADRRLTLSRLPIYWTLCLVTAKQRLPGFTHPQSRLQIPMGGWPPQRAGACSMSLWKGDDLFGVNAPTVLRM